MFSVWDHTPRTPKRNENPPDLSRPCNDHMVSYSPDTSCPCRIPASHLNCLHQPSELSFQEQREGSPPLGEGCLETSGAATCLTADTVNLGLVPFCLLFLL